MPTRQLKHKVGGQLFDTKQAAIAYAAENGGIPEKIIIEVDLISDPETEAPETPTADVEVTPEEEAPKRRGPGRPRKTEVTS